MTRKHILSYLSQLWFEKYVFPFIFYINLVRTLQLKDKVYQFSSINEIQRTMNFYDFPRKYLKFSNIYGTKKIYRWKFRCLLKIEHKKVHTEKKLNLNRKSLFTIKITFQKILTCVRSIDIFLLKRNRKKAFISKKKHYSILLVLRNIWKNIWKCIFISKMFILSIQLQC